MKKLTQFVCLILAVTLVATACGSNADNAKETSEKGKIKITLIHRYLKANVGKHSEDTAVLTMLEKFKKDHPDIEVVEEQLQSDEYTIKAQTLAAANDLPDVFVIPGAWMTNFVNNKLISPVDDDLNKNPAWRDGFRAGAFEAGNRNGSIYGVPIAAGPTHMLYYNSKIFADVGYEEFPKTWEELMDASEKIKQKGILPFVMGNKGSIFAESSWLSALGDRVTGPEWTQSIIEGNGAKFTDPEFVKALSLMYDLGQNGYLNKDINSVKQDMAKTYYYEGKAAAFSDGIWASKNIVDSAPKDILDVTHVTVFPAVTGGKGNPLSSSGGAGVYYGINSSIEPGEKRDAIIKMIEYMTGQESAEIMAAEGGFPAFKPIQFDETKLHKLSLESYHAANAADAVKIYDLWFDASVIEVMKNGLQALLAGAKKPEQLAKEIEDEYQNYLKKAKP